MTKKKVKFGIPIITYLSVSIAFMVVLAQTGPVNPALGGVNIEADIYNKLAISSDGSYAVATEGYYLYLVEKSSNSLKWSFIAGHNILSVAISTDGRYIAAGSQDTNAYLFEKASNAPVMTINTGGPVRSVALSSDGNYLVVGSEDNILYLINTTSRTELWRNISSSSNINAVAISSNGNHIMEGGEFEIRLFNSSSSTPEWIIKVNSWTETIALSADGNVAIAGFEDGTITKYNVTNFNDPIMWNSTANDRVNVASISSDGQYAIVGSEDYRVRIFSENNPTPVYNNPIGSVVKSVGISSDGRYAVASSYDFYLFDLDDINSIITTISTKLGYPAVISADGSCIAVPYTRREGLIHSLYLIAPSQIALFGVEYALFQGTYAGLMFLLFVPFTVGTIGITSASVYKQRTRAKKLKKKEAKQIEIAAKAGYYVEEIKIKRGFEVAGDTFRFFIRVQNDLSFGLSNVTVRIQPPNTLKLDKKTPSKEYSIGNIAPGKFGTAIYYLFCEACADTEINATVDFMDPRGSYQILKMEPFKIFSCKYITPREISTEEFDQKFESEDKKTLRIKLKEELADEEIINMLKERMTMSTVQSTTSSLEMAGMTSDGSDILLKSDIEKEEDGNTLVVSVASQNQNVQMGALSDVIEEFKEFRKEILDQFEVLTKGQVDIKETVVTATNKILVSQITEFEDINFKNRELRNEISKLRDSLEEYEGVGDFSKADMIQDQISSLNEQFRRSHQQLEIRMEEMVNNIVKILENQENIEEFLMRRLGSEFERIKKTWEEYKKGIINKKQLISQGIKIFGVKFAKLIIGKVT